MKTLLSAIGVLIAAANASAQLVYEPFDYSVGNLDGQINPGNGLPWAKLAFDPETEDNILVFDSNVSWSGLAPSTGRSVTYGGLGASERLSLGQDFSTGTFYYSLLFKVSTPVESPTFVAGFSNATGESEIQPQQVGTRLYLRQGPTSTAQNPTFSVGVSKNSSNESHILYDGEFALNTPIMVVGSYTIAGGGLGTDDIAQLWVNPSSSTFGAAVAPASDVIAPIAGTDLPNSDATGSLLSAFVLRQSSASVPAVQVDELRVDRTWAQVTPPVGISWSFAGNGAWSEDAKWSTLSRPNNAGAFVNFGSAAGGATSITVDGAYALRTINFTGGGPYTLSGGGTLNFSGSAAINVMAGSHAISAPIAMSADLQTNVRSGSTLTLSNVTSNGNSLTKAGAGTLQLTNARFNDVTIVGGKIAIAPAGTPGSVSRVGSLNINNSSADGVTTYHATLDLMNNDMVIDYTGASPLGTWDGLAYTGLLGAIQSGRNGGTWNGPGIITSQSAAVSGAARTTLGIAEASSVLKLTGSATASWRGQTVDATSLLIDYTYAGDANLDGRIDADDYFVIDRNYNRSGTVFGYGNGDFDYNGVINADDFFLIDASFAALNPSLPAAEPAGAVAVVPEPSALMFISTAAAASLLRRRRRQGRRKPR